MKTIRWTEAKLAEVTPLYENGGEPIGRLLVYYPEKEPEIWKMVNGVMGWKRWHLAAFRRMWKDRNPKDAKRIHHVAYQRKRRRHQAGQAMMEKIENRHRLIAQHRKALKDEDTK